MSNESPGGPDVQDRSGVEVEPRIEATVCITFNNFTPLNDSLMGWLNSFLNGRKEVKTVKIETFGFNQAISEVADGVRTEDAEASGATDTEIETGTG